MLHRPSRRTSRRTMITSVIAAVLALGVVFVGIAAARAMSLAVASRAVVTDTTGHTTRERIVVTRQRWAVYTLSGDSRRHPECTAVNHCFAFWPPATVRSLHPVKPAGIHGRLTTWRRDGFIQLVLNGHPLYRYAGDTRRDTAVGEGIVSFGGIWHVVRPNGAHPATTPVAASSAPSSTPSTGGSSTSSW